MERLAYTVDQAREQLGGVSRSLIYGWIKSGQLGSVKVGGRRLVSAQHLQTFLEDQEAVSA
jgi:excisionase family DNA binding protein